MQNRLKDNKSGKGTRDTLLVLLLLLFLSACTEETPERLMPQLTLNEAQDITRYSATLSGNAMATGNDTLTVVRFCYGTTEAMEQTAECNPGETNVTARLNGLTANTTYHYCLEAGNRQDAVRTPPLTFTTLPNRPPVVGNIELLGQGPLSAILQYPVPDNGGETVTSAGFYYQAEGGETLKLPATRVEDNETNILYRARLNNLHPLTTYTVQAYATNSLGETRSETFTFQTRQAIRLNAPGMLVETIGDEEKYTYTSLVVTGPLNGSDICFLRHLLGKGIHGEETPGRLCELDLTDARIEEGGSSYDNMHYTEKETIGQGMFADCAYLRKLALPAGILEIEDGGIRNCPQLTTLQIPAATVRLTPADRCPALSRIEVSAANKVFSSLDGVLYNKACTTLYWFPEGKEEQPDLPATLESIEAYAFRNCRIKCIDFPASIKEMKRGAFKSSALEAVTLPPLLELLSDGIFQDCQRLTTVVLGARINYLSDYCFSGCPLQHLYVNTTDMPPMCREYAFTQEQFRSCTLHVPQACVKMYKNSEYWGKFLNYEF